MKPQNYFYILPIAIAFLTSTGCSDDSISEDASDFLGKGSDKIGFIMNSSGGSASRSASSSSAENFELRSVDSTDSLHVCTTVCSIDDSETLSRGTAVESTSAVQSITATCFINDPQNGGRVYFQNQPYKRGGDGLFAHQNNIEYYWLSKNATYDFYNTTPIGATGLAFNGNGYSTFSYTVPQNALDQQDLMTSFATTEKTAEADPSTSYGFPVNVRFNHALTRITVQQGEGMAGGTINSITFTGLRGSGVFDIESNQWTSMSSPDNISYTYTANQATSDGASVTGTAGNFFMLPQELDGAEMQVSFTNAQGNVIVYSAPLRGVWQQSQHVTYTIVIRHDFQFELLTGSYIDAHYDRFSVKITPKDLGSSQSWTVGSTLANVTMLKADDYTTKDDYKLLREGYWTDKFTDGTSARGTSTLTFTGNTPQTIWVFVPENIGNEDRQVPLTITSNSKLIYTDKSMTQYCPYWDDTFGSEHIDTSQGVVWGFSWTGTETYTSSNITLLGLHWIDRWVYDTLQDLVNGKPYITYETTNAGIWGNTTYYKSLTIHYDQITLENAAESDDNGWQNTSDIYKFNGFNELNTIVSTLENNGYVSSSGGGTAINPSNSAAIAVLKNCNKWNVEKETTNEGDTYTIQFIAIDWYLPAVNQCNSTTFTGGSGVYWTSSAYPGSNVLSDTYTAPNGPTGSAERQSLHKVRAFRNK